MSLYSGPESDLFSYTEKDQYLVNFQLFKRTTHIKNYFIHLRPQI